MNQNEKLFGKIQTKKTFKASLELVCAILNYIFLNARGTLDLYGADPFQTLEPTPTFAYKLKKKQEEMQKIMVNKDIVPDFFAAVFDPSEFFAFNENLSGGKHHKFSK